MGLFIQRVWNYCSVYWNLEVSLLRISPVNECFNVCVNIARLLREKTR